MSNQIISSQNCIKLFKFWFKQFRRITFVLVSHATLLQIIYINIFNHVAQIRFNKHLHGILFALKYSFRFQVKINLSQMFLNLQRTTMAK